MKLRHLAALAALITSIAPVQAKSLVDNHVDSLTNSTKIIAVDGQPSSVEVDSTVRRRILTFYYDQFRNSQDPGSPYFIFMSKEHDVMMGIGGAVRMRGYYDWGGAVPTSSFAPSTILINPDPSADKHLGTTPAGTCLYFRLIGSNTLLGEYQAYIECNFNGYQGRDFHLKKAYVMFRDWTVGYASSTFCDPAAQFPMVDAAGPTNKGDYTAVLVRWMPRLTKNLLAAVSVETPQTFAAVDNTTTKQCSEYVPNVAAFLQYDWGRQNSQHIRLSALYRTMPYRDLVAGRNHNPSGWAVQLSSVSHPIDELTLYVTGSYGAGYGGMGGDLAYFNNDLVPLPGKNGEMYAPRSWGWSLGLQYNIKSNLFVTAYTSQTRFDPQKGIAADAYKYGQLIGCNVFYNPLPRVQIGAEFNLGKRQDFSHAHRWARRVGLMAQLSF